MTVKVRKLASEFVDLGIEHAAEEGLVEEPFRDFWKHVIVLGVNLIGGAVSCNKCAGVAISRAVCGELLPLETVAVKPPRAARYSMDDDTPFPFSKKYKGVPSGEVPDDFLVWFLRQDWCDQWPEVVEYANLTGVER